MSGFIKAVTVALVLGLACICVPEKAAALEGEEGDPDGSIPRYYLQLLEYSAFISEQERTSRPMLLEYIVERGDYLLAIAARFDTDVTTLVRLNKIANPHLIYPGQKLEILTTVGSVHDVLEGDTVASIADLYGVEEEVIIAANNLSSKPRLERGERVIVPGGIPSRGSVQGFALSWPLRGVFTSGYGWRNGLFHYGIDIAAPLGTPIHAAAEGKVTYAGYLGDYGLMVELEHGWGYATRYAHNGGLAVSEGQHVSRGQVIAYIGLTGNTTGPHLHFEVLLNGTRLNPLEFLD